MKKGKWNRMSPIFAAALAAVLFTGCGSAPNSPSNMAITNEYKTYESAELDAGFTESAAAPAEEAEAGEAPESGRIQSDDRKLIKRVNMTVETKSFDEALSAIQDKVAVLGGYIESMDTYNGSRYSSYSDSREIRNASMTARIPKDQLDGFLDTVSEVCNVISRSDSVEDITLTYVDLQSHKKALETEQARLLELLEQAGSIEDIITVEQRLSDVRYQLDSMESRLRTFDNQVDYSTVYMEIREVRELTPVAEKTVWERISGGFMSSLKGVGSGLLEFGIWFLVNLPYILVWAIIIAGLVLLIVGLTKRADKKRLRRAQKAAEQVTAQRAAAAETSQAGEGGDEDPQGGQPRGK